MFTDILAMFGTAFAAILDWLEFFIDEVGITAFIFGVFMMFTAVRLLLRPLMGQSMAGSDTARPANIDLMQGQKKLGTGGYYLP